MSENWKSHIRAVTPYTPGLQPKETAGLIKLNTNENPYPPSQGVEKVLRAFDADTLKRYPHPDASPLTEAIAQYHDAPKERVFVGVGSDEVLALIFLTCFADGKEILFPDVTYSFYDVWANLYRIPYAQKKLDEQFHIVAKDYFHAQGGVVFPNPNAPTGIAESLSTVEEIVKQNKDVVVVVDEAYVDFGAESALPLTESYDNLLVVRTFSKSRSLAGLRIGYAVGQEELIAKLCDVKYSFNSYTMNRVAIEAGVAAIKDETYFRATIEKILRTRKRLQAGLEELQFTCLKSSANFIFATHATKPAREIYDALVQENIYARHFSQKRIDNYLRITVGTDDEIDALLSFLKTYLGRT